MLPGLLLALLFQVRVADPVRSAEAAEMLLKARTATRGVTLDAQKQDGKFEEAFNALVKAMDAFSKKYNEGRGLVWPKQEAIMLQKALADLQKLPSLQARKTPR